MKRVNAAQENPSPTTNTRGTGPAGGGRPARRHALSPPSPSARPAKLGARLKPRLHSPTPPHRSPTPTTRPAKWGHCRTPVELETPAPERSDGWDGVRRRRPREPFSKQPRDGESGLPGGGRAGRGRGGAQRAVASPGRRAQGTWSGRGKGRAEEKSPSTAQPGMPQAAQRLAAAPARPAASRVRASGLPVGRGIGRRPTGTGLRPPPLRPGGIAPYGALAADRKGGARERPRGRDRTTARA